MPSPFRFLFICRCLESLHHREAEGHQLQKFFNGDSESRPLSASCRPHKHIKHFYAPSWATTPYPPHHVQLPSQTTCIPKAFGNTKPAECCNLVCQKNLIFNPHSRFWILGSSQPQSSEAWIGTNGKPICDQLEPWDASPHHTMKGLNSILYKRWVFMCTDDVIV